MSDNESQNDSEWFTICDEKNILLEKNENNIYKITFNVISKNSEDTVLNILKNGQFFELLSALNPDVIESIKVNEKSHEEIHGVFIKFKNTDEMNKDDSILNIHFFIKYKFKEGKCVITSEKKQNKLIINSSNKKIDVENSLFISQIKLKAIEKNEKTSLLLLFKLDNLKSSNFTNMYIGMYFKKIFYRFKQYFE